MKDKIIFTFVLFFGVFGVASALVLDCDKRELYTYSEAGVTYSGVPGVCDYYTANPEELGDDIFLIKDGDDCYVTHYIENIHEHPLYRYASHSENGVCPTNYTSFDDSIKNNLPYKNESGELIEDNFLEQDDLNIAKLVYEINKGEMTKKLKTTFGLAYFNAGAIEYYQDSTSKQILVVQASMDQTNTATLKINFSKDSKGNSIISATLASSDATKNMLDQLPFLILRAAPGFDDANKVYDDFGTDKIKASVSKIFADITKYKYTESGDNLNLTATVPDDVNAKVLAVYSEFLNINPMAGLNDGSGDTAASTEGEPTDETVKNTKTGAFLSIKVVVISLLFAIICYLGYRYSKIKKI